LGLAALDNLNIPEDVKKKIEIVVSLVRDELGECEVFLFGSFARGDWLLDSDVDLIVVSDSFMDQDYIQRLYRLKRLMLRHGISRVSFIPLTRREFQERKEHSVIISDAMSYAIRII